MLLVYLSRTGNVNRFIKKVRLPAVSITDDLTINEPYILITYTDKLGEVPEKVKDFLKLSSDYLKGVAASGNRNWGENFARSADVISKQYNVPVLHKFELSGLKSDVEKFKKRVEEIDETCGIK